MESLRDKVAIVGMGCTAYGDHYDKTGEDLLVEACYEAFEDAGVDQHDIQAAGSGAVSPARPSPTPSSSTSSLPPASRTGAPPAATPSATPSTPFAGGFVDVALVAGYVSKGEALRHANGIYGGGPAGSWSAAETSSPAARGTFATFATRYMHHYELSYPQLKEASARIAVKNYANGMLNPKAALHRKVDMKAY